MRSGFEDYLLRPAREGLGIPSLLWLSKVLDAHEDLAEREAAFAAVRQEIPDFDARVEKERAKATARLVETAKEHGGARDGAGRKSEDNQGENFPLKKERKTGSASPERVIARLKRDAQTDPNAQALLDTLSAGDISAHRDLKSSWRRPTFSPRRGRKTLGKSDFKSAFRNVVTAQSVTCHDIAKRPCPTTST